MCKWGTHEKVKVKIPANLKRERKESWRMKRIDSCIAPIVEALQKGGIYTKTSCCGHGRPLGDIYLRDGRVLLIDSKGEWITHRYRLLIKALWIHFIYPKRRWFRVRRNNIFWRLRECLKKN